ncbi:MAG TPA: MFS transporter [Verrucomicrobiae bacterium]|nr:MFS transporter [Verrucomicrobiae bacterium]
MKKFYSVLLNTLVANVSTSFLWFALTFWVYLETKSLIATSIIGGSYMLFVAICGLVFGTFVDKHKKKQAMLLSSAITVGTYAVAGLLFMAVPEGQLLVVSSPLFWAFILVILVGAVVENMRNIALSTTVTLLVPKEDRAKANGLVGSVTGVAFMVTSVFSGLSIGILGMGWTLAIAFVLTAIALIHLFFVDIPEEEIFHDPELAGKKIDFKGSLAAVRVVPGLLALIFFATFNNLLGGVFMSLMDAYGLSLMPVEVWGIVLGIVSTGFIIGGLILAKFGLGKNPLKTLLLINVLAWLVCIGFTIREWAWLVVVGFFVYMIITPAAEAAEHTVIQRVVPFKQQGRVFGFAQSVESAAAPITAFMIGPIAEAYIVPFMNSTAGKDMFGWLLGSGNARGIALVFVLAGIIGLIVTLFAFTTKSYRRLSQFYAKS